MNATRNKRRTSEIQDNFSDNNILVYPEDLTGASDQGHYVQFFINEQTAGSLEPKGRTAGNSDQVRLKRAPTKEVNKSICLYMPASVEASYSANYTDMEIGTAALAGLAAYDAYNSAGGNATEGVKRGINAAGDVLLEGGALKVLGALEEIGVSGAKSVVELRAGKVINNRMEMIFENVSKRSFSFTFKFIPRSETESNTVAEIIRTFKIHMLPTLEGNSQVSRTYVVPSTFDIQYMYRNKENQYLNKISTCVLADMGVKYGGDRFQTMRENDRGAPPAEIEVTLAFSELEVLTSDRAKQGY